MAYSPLIKRRTMIKGTVAAAALTPLSARPGLAATEVSVMTWEGYSDEAWVARFEEMTGATVTLSYIGSIDELTAKLAAGGGGYDIVTPDVSSFARFIDQGLLQPIDRSAIPNLANLLPAFQELEALRRDGHLYGVPFTWGSLPMLYRNSTYPEPPTSWDVFWDPANRGRVLIQDDANNNVTWAAIALGFKDPYHLTDEQFDAVREKLIALKNNALTFYTGLDDGASIFINDSVDLLFPMGQAHGALIRSRGIEVTETVPVEGAAGWIDCWGIPAGAINPELAHNWINAMLEADVGLYQSETYGVASAMNQAGNDAIGMDYADRLIWMQAPEDYSRRVDLWNEVKASF